MGRRGKGSPQAAPPPPAQNLHLGMWENYKVWTFCCSCLPQEGKGFCRVGGFPCSSHLLCHLGGVVRKCTPSLDVALISQSPVLA